MGTALALGVVVARPTTEPLSLVLALCCSGLGGCTQTLEDTPPAPSAASYPLEILGEPGTEVRVSLELSASDLAAAGNASIALTVHNVLEPGSALARVNGGSAIDLGASELARPWGATVASGVIPIDRAALREGPNDIVFRHERRVIDVLPMSGFRVLSVAVVLDGRRIALELPMADPATFDPPRSDADSIERGRAFFQEVSRDGGPTCSRCHTRTGADLAYYGFSNHALIERAMFHAFNLSEAEDIASYIRSLDVLPVGRPYEAPFQPGADNRGAAGAGLDAIVSDEAFAAAAFGDGHLPDDLAWDWAAAVDTYRLPTTVALLSWHRFLPRAIDPSWYELASASLADAEQAFSDAPSFDTAHALMRAAVDLGREIFASGNNDSRVNLLRHAAVELWDWSRNNGFDEAHHGFVDVPQSAVPYSPAYLYEVGFAFFEAKEALPYAFEQTLQWWWAQLAVHPGRGLSDGTRPLNYFDVLDAAEKAGAGPSALAFLHLLGTWEESRGALAGTFESADGVVRHLAVPVRHLPPDDRAVLFRRFFAREEELLAAGATLSAGHHAELGSAWAEGCAALSAAQRLELRARAPAEIRPDLSACP